MKNSGKLNHIAIIMDGNGRWARRKGLPRSRGHQAGTQTLENIIQWCIKRKIEYLTVYAFSTENWKRPPSEIRFLMSLLKKQVDKKLDNFNQNGIRLNIYGDIRSFSPDVRSSIRKAMKLTEQNTRLNLNMALNYGGRDEILRAVKKMIKDPEFLKTKKLTEDKFLRYLDQPDIPDPDLLIRTGGDIRISNFLLWEVSYSELYFTPVLWPDFTEKDLDHAIHTYRKRERRFGKVGESL